MYVCQEVKKSESDWPFIALSYNKIRHHDYTHLSIYLRTCVGAAVLYVVIHRDSYLSVGISSGFCLTVVPSMPSFCERTLSPVLLMVYGRVSRSSVFAWLRVSLAHTTPANGTPFQHQSVMWPS